jgi:TolB protein
MSFELFAFEPRAATPTRPKPMGLSARPPGFGAVLEPLRPSRAPRTAPLLAVAALLVAAGGATPQGDWSPERAALVYTSQASGNSDLWLAAKPDGDTINLTENPAQDHWASWFPDGERLAFQTLRDGNREVYVMDADGGGLTNLTNHPAQDLLPEVSPDGTRIVFFSDRGIEHGPRELPGHLYVMDADGGSVERLTVEPLTSTFFGSWSPDGRTILLARDFGGDVDLVVLDLETRQERRIRGTPASESGGRFSPDGGTIAFSMAKASGESRIVLVTADGSGRRELTRGAQHYQPNWSPDGHWLIFSAASLQATQFDLMTVSVDDGTVRALVATEVDERSGSWRPAHR